MWNRFIFIELHTRFLLYLDHLLDNCIIISALSWIVLYISHTVSFFFTLAQFYIFGQFFNPQIFVKSKETYRVFIDYMRKVFDPNRRDYCEMLLV